VVVVERSVPLTVVVVAGVVVVVRPLALLVVVVVERARAVVEVVAPVVEVDRNALTLSAASVVPVADTTVDSVDVDRSSSAAVVGVPGTVVGSIASNGLPLRVEASPPAVVDVVRPTVPLFVVVLCLARGAVVVPGDGGVAVPRGTLMPTAPRASWATCWAPPGSPPAKASPAPPATDAAMMATPTRILPVRPMPYRRHHRTLEGAATASICR
jgi:hypothetical protein